MKENKLISVIIPVYNIENYLPRCIESVIAQTYQNIEIILVDDGSTDKSGAICDKYAGKDKRVRVIHKENGGVSTARNAGIDASTGEYIAFVDGDDYVSDRYIDALYNDLVGTESDISVAEHKEVFDYTSDSDIASYDSAITFSQRDFVSYLLGRNVICSCWGKLYKRTLFSDIRFPAGRVHAEDVWVLYKVCFKASRVVFNKTVLYYYFIREGSAVQKNFDIEIYNSNVEVYEEIMQECEKKYPDLIMLTNADRLNVYFKMLYRIMCADNRREFSVQENEMTSKIKIYSKGFLKDKTVGKNLKIKIISFSISKYVYFFVQKLSDFIKQLKAGHKYVV